MVVGKIHNYIYVSSLEPRVLLTAGYGVKKNGVEDDA